MTQDYIKLYRKMFPNTTVMTDEEKNDLTVRKIFEMWFSLCGDASIEQCIGYFTDGSDTEKWLTDIKAYELKYIKEAVDSRMKKYDETTLIAFSSVLDTFFGKPINDFEFLYRSICG